MTTEAISAIRPWDEALEDRYNHAGEAPTRSKPSSEVEQYIMERIGRPIMLSDLLKQTGKNGHNPHWVISAIENSLPGYILYELEDDDKRSAGLRRSGSYIVVMPQPEWKAAL